MTLRGTEAGAAGVVDGVGVGVLDGFAAGVEPPVQPAVAVSRVTASSAAADLVGKGDTRLASSFVGSCWTAGRPVARVVA
jgi:hypothetical protein